MYCPVIIPSLINKGNYSTSANLFGRPIVVKRLTTSTVAVQAIIQSIIYFVSVCMPLNTRLCNEPSNWWWLRFVTAWRRESIECTAHLIRKIVFSSTMARLLISRGSKGLIVRWLNQIEFIASNSYLGNKWLVIVIRDWEWGTALLLDLHRSQLSNETSYIGLIKSRQIIQATPFGTVTRTLNIAIISINADDRFVWHDSINEARIRWTKWKFYWQINILSFNWVTFWISENSNFLIVMPRLELRRSGQGCPIHPNSKLVQFGSAFII